MSGPIIIYPAYVYYDAEPIEVEIEICGSYLNVEIAVDPIEIEIEIGEANAPISLLIIAGPIEVTLEVISGLVTVESSSEWESEGVTNWMSNWVWWSKIGYLDFTVDQSNKAGRRPMDWKGTVYEIIKLGSSVIVYGSNGVTVMKPSDVHWGMETINHIGIKDKSEAIGTNFEHYFIDNTDCLYRLTEKGLERLDYSEYLSEMSRHILTFDPETGMLYICDGTIGYIYSSWTKSFGRGPGDVTGLGVQDDELFVCSNSGIETPKFHICTDIYDLGSRKPKTIETIEVGTDLTNNLRVMVEFRQHNKAVFGKSVWKLVNPSGIAYLPCFGVEFKFHVMSYIKEYFELDYLKIGGVVHGAEYLDYSRQVV